jgi:hypothetical protein
LGSIKQLFLTTPTFLPEKTHSIPFENQDRPISGTYGKNQGVNPKENFYFFSLPYGMGLWTQKRLLENNPDLLLHLASANQGDSSAFHEIIEVGRELKLCNADSVFFVKPNLNPCIHQIVYIFPGTM